METTIQDFRVRVEVSGRGLISKHAMALGGCSVFFNATCCMLLMLKLPRSGAYWDYIRLPLCFFAVML